MSLKQPGDGTANRSPKQSLFSLEGEVVVVTGGAGLYGLPISQALAEAGATVIIASRDLERNERVASELRACGLRVYAQALDMSDATQIERFLNEAIEREGKIDVLINNAVSRPVRDFWTSTEEQWRDSLQTNIIGIHLCCQMFGRHMTARRKGNIINISSIYGMVGPTFPIYEGTSVTCPPDYAFHKGGLINYTRYLATLLALSVRVNCLSLGGLQTEDEDPKFVSQYSRHCPMGRKATAADVKGPIVFLASAASQYMTGHNLVVDGGWTAW